MATKPRQVLPGRTWFVTGRAIAREHRFVPTPEVAETIGYCLAVTGQKYEVALHSFVWMSNHYHLVLTDVAAQLPDFMRDLNSLISKALNATRGSFGQNFDRRGYNAIVVADLPRLLRHCAYTEANPCLAHLVEHAEEWEGISSAKLEYGETMIFRRPKHGLWGQPQGPKDQKRSMYCGRIKCPEVARIQLVQPPGIGDEKARHTRAQVRSQIKSFEKQAKTERDEAKQKPLGMAKVRSFHPTDSPCNLETHFDTEPQVSCEDPALRRSIIRRIEEFISRYRASLEEYRKNKNTQFPEGTWWMKRCLNQRCYCYHPSG